MDASSSHGEPTPDGVAYEAIYKLGIGSAVASLLGFATLVVAHYLSLDGMQWATGIPEDEVCRACFTRSYPTRVPSDRLAAKLRFEGVASR